MRRRAIAEAYQPIIRGVLLPAAAYYLFVTWGHFYEEEGFNLLVLGGMSLFTALSYAFFRGVILARPKMTLAGLEAVGLAMNLLMFINVVIHMQMHLEEQKLVYFVLMAVLFSTTGITLRGTFVSVVLALAGMFWFARQASPEVFSQFAFIGMATSFASFGMATLLRKAIIRQIDARLLADRYASLDGLTGVANRRSIMRRLDELVLDNKPFWLGILDLDGFKSVNDLYGHSAGDRLLCEVVDRLSGLELTKIEIGRMGGDEFAILCYCEPHPTDVTQIGDTIISVISRPYDLSPVQLNISGTIGFAHFPTMGTSSRDLYDKADYALYRGKQHARRQAVVFTDSQDLEMQERLTLERALRGAKLEEELSLLFQPQVDVASGNVVGFEALARWDSPVLGPVRPDRFIRAAERAGLIQSVTRTLFSKALNAVDLWPSELSVSFNLSAHDLTDRTFIFSLVAEVMARDIKPSRIEFEITETAVMKDITAARALLQDLAALGFKIALDDFGSGYSSFEYLDELPLTKVKIDRSFVRKVATSATSQEIVSGVITLCRNLDLSCVLEGVETQQEMETLAPLSPQLIQGYLFGKPMSQRDVLSLLLDEARKAGRAM